MSKAAFGQIGGDGPAISVEALDDLGATQGFQPANVRFDVPFVVDAGHGLAHGVQMLGGPIDTVGVGLLQDVLIGNARGAGRWVYRYDAATPYVLNLGRRNLQMMNAPVHAVDDDGHVQGQGRAVVSPDQRDDGGTLRSTLRSRVCRSSLFRRRTKTGFDQPEACLGDGHMQPISPSSRWRMAASLA